jgi:hypothetical protein
LFASKEAWHIGWKQRRWEVAGLVALSEDVLQRGGGGVEATVPERMRNREWNFAVWDLKAFLVSKVVA